MNESCNFSYVVVDRKQVDTKGNHLVNMYPVWIKNSATDLPIQTLQSIIPSVIVKIYAGNPYPSFDYTEAVEGQVKFDIAQNAEYVELIAAQINGEAWHLTPLITSE